MHFRRPRDSQSKVFCFFSSEKKSFLPQAPQPLRFIAIWLAVTLATLALIAGFNAAVDPYLVTGAPRIAGFNAAKPEADTHTALAKSHLFPRRQWRGLILGDSKADIGLDPHDPAWPADARPAFNHGLPGIGLETILDLLRQDLAAAPINRVLILIDIQTLLAPPLPALPGDLPPPPAALPFASQDINDLLLATLSMDALHASLVTIAAQGRTAIADLADDGATGEGGLQAEVAATGERALFAAKDAELTIRFARLTAYLRDHPDAGAHRLDLIAAMIAICRAHGAALSLVVAPYHADYLTIVTRAGLWPRILAAKSALARLAASSPGVRLFDFLGDDHFSTDPVPPPGDRTTQTIWFWEPTHFKKRLGARLLARLYAP